MQEYVKGFKPEAIIWCQECENLVFYTGELKPLVMFYVSMEGLKMKGK